ncbi:hypothetical protein Tco_1299903 [Tanacetum coccineum]
MGDENPIRTLEVYSKSCHKSYENTIELPKGTICTHRKDKEVRKRYLQTARGDQPHNGRNVGLLKELTASKTTEKVLMRKEARHPITKIVNSISLIRIEEGENGENNGQIDKSVTEPGISDEEGPPKGIDMKNEVERKAHDEPTESERKKSRTMKRMSQQEFPVPMM